ncbi:hypothetical protein IQ255_07740 [Pleurocapsales cyanobacterium LEGE 10410]|nr:hypothetical protein [Pleurocapsales cyanobacterium LEGE 10410]
MRQSKENKKGKYDIDLTKSHPEIIREAVRSFEERAIAQNILEINENGYALENSRFKSKKAGSLSASHPTVKKFADYMFYLKSFNIVAAEAVNLSPKKFRECWKLSTNTTWWRWVKNNIETSLLESEHSCSYSSQPRFKHGIELVYNAAASGVMNDKSPAFFIGAYCSKIWAKYREVLLEYVETHNYQVRILGQNPYTERAKKLAEDLDTDIETFIRIKEECLILESEAPNLIRVNFDYDLDDYYYQGIFSETNKHYISYKLFFSRKLNIEKAGVYEIKNNQDLREYGDVFAKIRYLYRDGAWELPAVEYSK